MHYYSHHIGDFIKATARLTDAQTMAYLRLLWMYYDSEKPLNPDTKVLAFQIGSSVEETQLLLESFFRLTDSGWNHTRCNQEIAEYHAMRESKANAGRASAERRKNKSTADVEQVLNTRSSDVQLTNNHKPITNNHIKGADAPVSVDKEVWEDFMKIRKAKKAPMTKTALDAIKREAENAGWPLNDAIRECVTRGWQGFKAEWVDKRTQAGPDPTLAKLKEDEVLARPMPANIRQMLSAVKRMP